MGFEGLGDLMRSRCLSQETQKPHWLSAGIQSQSAAHFVEHFIRIRIRQTRDSGRVSASSGNSRLPDCFPGRFPESQRKNWRFTVRNKRFPSSRCASAIQIVHPRESIAETQPQTPAGFLEIVGSIVAKSSWRLQSAIRNLQSESSRGLSSVGRAPQWH